ncbi:hypothetical protein WISP_33076 [Willisornis vidua]|uniref:Uncharacterized protein n=1 Tax=Willisornis vidua TaxID=1566151 RepID=A0ABQ9DMJ0_9PASS|nr:hypothetical protein WISP_33076 [Willisornis vidua]
MFMTKLLKGNLAPQMDAAFVSVVLVKHTEGVSHKKKLWSYKSTFIWAQASLRSIPVTFGEKIHPLVKWLKTIQPKFVIFASAASTFFGWKKPLNNGTLHCDFWKEENHCEHVCIYPALADGSREGAFTSEEGKDADPWKRTISLEYSPVIFNNSG